MTYPDIPSALVTRARFSNKQRKTRQRDARAKIMAEENANISKKIIYPGSGNELVFTPGSKVFGHAKKRVIFYL